jgi:hypothetical protein
MDQAKIATFRKKIVQDEAFRTAFAKSPSDALRSIGIEVPKEVKFPSMDKAELDKQVEAFKKAAGSSLDKLFAAGELSERDLESVAGGLTYSTSLTSNSLFQFSSRLAQPFQTKVSPGGVYTISAFGTLDW